MSTVPKSSKPAPPPLQDGRRSDAAINSYAQHRLELWLKDHPDKLAVHVAADFGISAFVISTLRKHGEGVGWHVARQLAKAFGLTLGEFVIEADKFWAEQTAQRNGVDSLRELPEWPTALAEAIGKHGADRAAAESVGYWRAHFDGKLTGKLVAALAAAAIGATNAPKPSRRR